MGVNPEFEALHSAAGSVMDRPSAFATWMQITERAIAVADNRRVVGSWSGVEAGRETNNIHKQWEKIAAGCLGEDLESGKRILLPRLVKVDSTEAMITLVMEPPEVWPGEKYGTFAAALCRRWSGKHPVIHVRDTNRLERKRVTVEIAMKALPAVVSDGAGGVVGGVPYPADLVNGPGVGIGVDAMGRVHSINFGPNGIPHLLVAGPTGSGKTTAMRHIGLGLSELGYPVWCADPKREGDLDGISDYKVAYSDAEIARMILQAAEVRERRAADKARGIIPQFGLILLIDEARSILQDKTVGPDAVKAYNALIQLGRGTAVHVITGIQQASAKALGGDSGTFVRENHIGRIMVGAAPAISVKMMFDDRNLLPSHEEEMIEACKGRALVSGLNINDMGAVHSIQVFGKNPRDEHVMNHTVVDDREQIVLDLVTPIEEQVADTKGVRKPKSNAVSIDLAQERQKQLLAFLDLHADWISRSDAAKRLQIPDKSMRTLVDRLADEGNPQIMYQVRGTGANAPVWICRITGPAQTSGDGPDVPQEPATD